MKQLLISALLLMSIAVFAQKFEGTIVWEIKTEITDPKVKAQMEEAQKKMSDPAMQAQMKEVQYKMEHDPEFKKMLEENPQMKAQIDKMISRMESGNINSMMPKGYTLKIKGQRFLSLMEGGMMDFEFLSADGKTFLINRASKTYSSAGDPAPKERPEVKVTKTKEKTKILGYECIRYNVETKMEGYALTQIVWATSDIKDIDLKALAGQHINNKQALFYDEIDGVPLKTEIKMAQGNMSMTVKEIKRESLPDALFSLPADFREVPMMGVR